MGRSRAWSGGRAACGPTFGALACAFGGAQLRFVEPIGFALDVDDLGAMDEPVDQDDDYDRNATKRFTPSERTPADRNVSFPVDI